MFGRVVQDAQVNFGGMFGRVVQDAKLTLVGCLACYTGMNKLLLCPFHYQVSTYLIFATELSQKIPDTNCIS